MPKEVGKKPVAAAAAAVQLGGVSGVALGALAHEFLNPTETLNIKIADAFQQKRDHSDTTACYGVGKNAVKSKLASFKVIEWE
ncbi:MAG: hypothetical protein ACKVP2_00465 [Burkholderiales bacterium]